MNLRYWFPFIVAVLVLSGMLGQGRGLAQTPPSATEEKLYTGLHAAALAGDGAHLKKLIADGANINERDSYGRTPAHIAAYKSHEHIIKILADAGADMNALENDAYDIVTIAAVANDVEMLSSALSNGCRPGNITSPYDGTALIAAAHLGHHEVVRILVEAGAPLDHINNLGWTALIEAIVLGDGGPRHAKTTKILLDAGADVSIADRNGLTPLELAQQRQYSGIIDLFSNLVR